MDDESRGLIDRVREVIAHRDALIDERDALIAERDTLRADADRLHRSWLEAGADAERFGRERDEARALIAAAGAVISEIGCEGPCSVCRIADALQPMRGAR